MFVTVVCCCLVVLHDQCVFCAELIPEKQRQEEMRKLYSAIGYSENDVITPFPKEVRAFRIIITVGGKSIRARPIHSSKYSFQLF